jgi:hypothetical protein
VDVPAVADFFGGHERREAHAQSMGTRRCVNRLAGQQLIVGSGYGVGDRKAELHLREPVFGVQPPDLQAVGVEIVQQLCHRLVDCQQRVGAVRRAAIGGLDVLGVAPDEELDLIPDSDLEAKFAGVRHLRL